MAEIEFLLLGDHAEALNGKLYMMGAGWTDSWRGERPEGAPTPITHFGVGVGVLVPYTETNRQHHLALRVEREDGQQIALVEADLEMGRPPGLPAGSDQRAIMALNAEVQFPEPGGYRVVGELGGQQRSVSFRVHDRAQPR